jgi:hypothetical protein
VVVVVVSGLSTDCIVVVVVVFWLSADCILVVDGVSGLSTDCRGGGNVVCWLYNG